MPCIHVCICDTGLWKKVQERITQRKTMSLCEREEEAIGVVEAVLAQSKAKITLSQVKRTTRQPEPYNKPCLNTTEEVCCCIDQSRRLTCLLICLCSVFTHCRLSILFTLATFAAQISCRRAWSSYAPFC